MSTLAVIQLVGVEIWFELRGLQGGLPSNLVARMHSETDRYLVIPLLLLFAAGGW